MNENSRHPSSKREGPRDAPPPPRRPAGSIGEARLVIGLALVFGAALAAVQARWGPVIAANKENETLSVVPRLVPGAAVDKTEKLFVESPRGKKRLVYRARTEDGALKGWVVPAKGQGFADQIEVLIGLDAEVEVITGIFVLSQKETPGLGDNITDGPKFTDQFSGAPARPPLRVLKEGRDEPHELKPVTGATISSESVCSIVNQTVAALRGELKNAPAPSSGRK